MNYRTKYIRTVTFLAAVVICGVGIWHQSQMRVAALEAEIAETETRCLYQFSEAVRELYALRQTDVEEAEAEMQARAAGVFLTGLSLSTGAKEAIYACLHDTVQDSLLQDLTQFFKSGAFAENTIAENNAKIELLCDGRKPERSARVKNADAVPADEILTDSMRAALADVFDGNENFSYAECLHDAEMLYFYHGNRYLTMYTPLRAPCYYVYGCTPGAAVLDREACREASIVFLQRTLPTTFRGGGIPSDTGTEPDLEKDGFCYFSIAYPAYPDAPITVGVRRDTGSVVYMDARDLLACKISRSPAR